MRQFPVGRSFVDAAQDAVIRAGDAVTDMAYFPARDETPKQVCQAAVEAVVVGGSRVPAGHRVSDGGAALDAPTAAWMLAAAREWRPASVG